MIKPDKLSFTEIKRIADDFRSRYCPNNEFPVPIEEIIEFDLGIEVRPIDDLRIKTDLDAVISSNLDVIFIDKILMENHRYLFRYRFALAHEAGHFILHEGKLRSLKFNSVEEWIEKRSQFDEEDLMWFERQAMEFGGRLLVPYELLLAEVAKLKGKIQNYYDSFPDGGYEVIADFIATGIHRGFEVSSEVIKRRIINEKILEALGFQSGR